jgi:glycerol-3-phosphate acyltransferase PlsY
MSTRIICLLLGYAFGLIQTSYIYSKAKGVDIRKMGSGNAGSTNALRTMGAKAGAITLLGDVFKCVFAVLVVWLMFHQSHPELFPLLKVWTAAGVILGHDFPFYMDFKGGKGIAATAGMVLSFGDWRLLAGAVICFFGIFFLTHYVSLGSILMSFWFFAGMTIFSLSGSYSMTRNRLQEMCILTALLAGLNIWQHRANIGRLVHGNERKTYLRKKAEQ